MMVERKKTQTCQHRAVESCNLMCPGKCPKQPGTMYPGISFIRASVCSFACVLISTNSTERKPVGTFAFILKF